MIEEALIGEIPILRHPTEKHPAEDDPEDSSFIAVTSPAAIGPAAESRPKKFEEEGTGWASPIPGSGFCQTEVDECRGRIKKQSWNNREAEAMRQEAEEEAREWAM